MLQKLFKTFLIVLILAGVVLATLNFFTSTLNAGGSFYGTVTYIQGSGIHPENPAWLDEDYWCIGEAFDCAIVME